MVKSVKRRGRKRSTDPLDIVPLGGLGEFGSNMMTYRTGGSMVVVDAGLMFPGTEHPGVNLLLPDTSYLDEHRDELEGIVLTHAHEDHIGALPFLIRDLDVPIFGTRLTLAMVRRRLEEHKLLSKADLREIAPGEPFQVGGFGAECIHVTHSLADAVAIVLDTPHGKILHTGDFKVDGAPPVGPPIDLKRLAALGDEGVLCMLSDSTNAEVPGNTPEEASVGPSIESIVRSAKGRVILSCFASSTHRIQLAFDIAAATGRKVALVGRSMVDNSQLAMDLGYLRAAKGVLCSVEDLPGLAPRKQLVLAAGSQGEQLSALYQVSNATHRYIKLDPGDKVILSARVIPGNERSINRIVNKLLRLGADVVQPSDAAVHVSGHASAEDLEMVLRLVRPKNFVPIHGEWRQLFHHANLARASGVDADRVFLSEDGDVLRLDRDDASRVDHFDLEKRSVDGSGLGLVDDCIVRERRQIAAAGVLVPMIALSANREPAVSDILSRGFNDNEEAEALLSKAHDAMLAAIAKLGPDDATDERAVEEAVAASLKRFFRRRSIHRPVILPVVVGAKDP